MSGIQVTIPQWYIINKRITIDYSFFFFFSLMLGCNSLLYRQLNINLQLLFFVFVVTRKHFQGQILILLQRNPQTKFLKLKLRCCPLSGALFLSFYQDTEISTKSIKNWLPYCQGCGGVDNTREADILWHIAILWLKKANLLQNHRT